jgi:putative hydroxymethylpyrimidine transport system substrate-binding protein
LRRGPLRKPLGRPGLQEGPRSYAAVRMRVTLALLAGALALALATGCGGSDEDRPERSATLVLDFAPNAVHAGIYVATARGYDDAEGVALHVRTPSASTEGLKLLLARRADFAVLDIHDLALARQQGRDVVGILPLVQRPLAAVLAQPSVRSPRDLEGRMAGVTGLPSDTAVLHSIVRGAGGDPGRVRAVTIGFNAVQALLGGRVAAATAFWNVEGVALRARRPSTREFRVDDYGAPAYPELVVCATRAALREQPALARATVAALVRGYQEVLNDPESAVAEELHAAPDLDRAQLQAQLDAVSPALVGNAPRFGALQPAVLRAWSRWEARFGIVRHPPDVAATFDARFLPQ